MNVGCQDISLIHQVYITDDLALPDPIPEAIQTNLDRVKQLYPRATIKLWSGAMLKEMFAAHFDGEVGRAFDTLGPYSYKCDLARMCLLYKFGGLYLDLSIFLLEPFKVPRTAGVATFRDRSAMQPGWTNLVCGVIWAQPGRRELRLCIDQIVSNCRSKYYGINPLYPTGPILFGKCFAKAIAEWTDLDDVDQQWIGEVKYITPGAAHKNICFVTPANQVVALLFKRIGGDLTHLGASGTNNYNEIWGRRQVYGERVMTWPAGDPLVRVPEEGVARTPQDIVVPAGFTGLGTYGPYVTLAEGNYKLSVDFTSKQRRFLLSKESKVVVQVTAKVGSVVISRQEHVMRVSTSGTTIDQYFSLDEEMQNVEFTTFFFGDFEGCLKGFRLEKMSS